MKVLTQSVHTNNFDPFDEETKDIDVCGCESAILQNYQFNHYNKSKDGLGTSFDDFGYLNYKDANNEEYKVFAHCFLGVLMSGSHPIGNPDVHGMTPIRFEKDNSVIPQIKKMLEETAYKNNIEIQMSETICNYCKEVGHKIEACPKIRCRRCGSRGHTDRACTSKICDHCHKRGHTIDICYRLRCTRCGQNGHSFEICKEVITCRFCKEEGHLVGDCPRVVCRHCDDNHFTSQCPYVVNP